MKLHDKKGGALSGPCSCPSLGRLGTPALLIRFYGGETLLNLGKHSTISLNTRRESLMTRLEPVKPHGRLTGVRWSLGKRRTTCGAGRTTLKPRRQTRRVVHVATRRRRRGTRLEALVAHRTLHFLLDFTVTSRVFNRDITRFFERGTHPAREGRRGGAPPRQTSSISFQN